MVASVIFTIIVSLVVIFIAIGGPSGLQRTGADEAIVVIVAIVMFVVINEIIRKRFDHKRGASQDTLTQMQADLNELRKSVAEIREYMIDLYIQQHDQKLK